MKVEFLQSFSRDLDKIKQKKIKRQIRDLITELENLETVNEISHLRKLSGFKNAFRIRIGDYRIGIFIENNVVELARLAHRKDIYKIFP